VLFPDLSHKNAWINHWRMAISVMKYRATTTDCSLSEFVCIPCVCPNTTIAVLNTSNATTVQRWLESHLQTNFKSGSAIVSNLRMRPCSNSSNHWCNRNPRVCCTRVWVFRSQWSCKKYIRHDDNYRCWSTSVYYGWACHEQQKSKFQKFVSEQHTLSTMVLAKNEALKVD